MSYDCETEDDNLKIAEVNRGYFIFTGMIMASIAVVVVALCSYYFQWHELVSELVGISLFTVGIALLTNKKSLSINKDLKLVKKEEIHFFFFKSKAEANWDNTPEVLVYSSMTGGAFKQQARFFFTIHIGELEIMTCSAEEEAFECASEISKYLNLPIATTGNKDLFSTDLWEENLFRL